MKAIIFYITFILSILLICCTELSFTWLVLAVLDTTLMAHPINQGD